MKALIRYLPVDELLEDFGYAFNEDGDFRNVNGEEYLLDVAIKCKYKKAKPFAVTHNFKVGDQIKTVYEIQKYKWVVEIKVSKNGCLDEILLSTHKDIAHSNYDDYWFKWNQIGKENFIILKEVSPEATFVEDGKEYEMEEKRIWDKCKIKVMHMHSVKDGCTTKQIYRVKCPCCGDFK